MRKARCTWWDGPGRSLVKTSEQSVLVGGDMPRIDEVDANDLAEPVEAHAHEAGFARNLFRSGAVDGCLIVYEGGCREEWAKTALAEQDEKAEEVPDGERCGDGFGVAGREGDGCLKFGTPAEAATIPEEGVSEPRAHCLGAVGEAGVDVEPEGVQGAGGEGVR